MITFLVLVVGGINWLLVGLFGWDIGVLFGGMENIVSRLIYIIIGAAAIYEVVTHKARCKGCGVDKAPAAPGGEGNPAI